LNDWWLPQRDKITTDLKAMTPQQLQRIADLVLTQVARDYSACLPAPDCRSADRLAEGLRAIDPTDKVCSRARALCDGPWWWPQDVTGAMLPYFLQLAGFVTSPAGGPSRQDWVGVRYDVALLLGQLRRNGAAKDLGKIASDTAQVASTRLTCLLGLWAAGEKIPAQPLFCIIDGGNAGVRVPAIMALRYTAPAEREAVRAKLLALDEGAKGDRHKAVLFAMVRVAPGDAVPRLKEIIDAGASSYIEVGGALEQLGEIPTKASASALADFIARTPAGRDANLAAALSAFEEVTHCGLMRGRIDDRDAGPLAARMLEWWEAHKDSCEGLVTATQPATPNSERTEGAHAPPPRP
jgi:hypothetical protein